MSGRWPTFSLLQMYSGQRCQLVPWRRCDSGGGFMAVQIDQIRERANRVAGSHGLEVVDVELQGSAKQRVLRVFVEKDAAGRAALIARAKTDEAASTDLPKGVPVEQLSGVTHEDCGGFAQDFGTVLDVEDLVPGAEYTLEVSSPGLERKLHRPEDFERFAGSLVKVQTFSPINGNRHWKGRLTRFAGDVLTIHLAAIKQKGKAGRAAAAAGESIEIPLGNVEKANLIAEL